jgi:hypothetical protein
VECAEYCTKPGDVTMLRDPIGFFGNEKADYGVACGGTIATYPDQMICCNPPSTTCAAGTYPELCLVSSESGIMISKGGGCADCDSCEDGEAAIRCGQKRAFAETPLRRRNCRRALIRAFTPISNTPPPRQASNKTGCVSLPSTPSPSLCPGPIHVTDVYCSPNEFTVPRSHVITYARGAPF